MKEKYEKDLLKFIGSSPSCFHVVDFLKKALEKAGFQELQESREWKIEAGKNYYVTRNLSSIAAFRVPEKIESFHIIASHSDSPTFKIKEHPEMTADKKYTKLNVEKYGGMLMAPWFDRPLSVAGRLLVKEKNGLHTVLVNMDRDLVLIPNLAVHMNRNVNEGYKYNAQKDMLPLYGSGVKEGRLLEQMAEAAEVQAEDVEGHDLFLYNRMPGSIWGEDKEFLSAPRLDDLECVFASLQALLQMKSYSDMPVMAVLDNEEVGSTTKQGAASTFLKDVFRRIQIGVGMNEESWYRAVASSFMVSSDNAHGTHPNYLEKTDPTNRTYLNEGIVIKYNANQRYTTDAVSAAVFKSICDKAKVPYQTFANPSDIAGGSTLGNIANTQFSVNTVDIGLAQLAMHSPYETAGVKDIAYLVRAIQTFFECRIECVSDGEFSLKF
ncbi:MAG: M18 family aminopeptidase [Clostridia bacterium]|nr:M18 family aminopeptidase [Lachnospiraceae bacterium]NCC01017.1 M18 family aminopeptidase [Clostridia bacterium]NCD02919.1 M18 family aminopeptidase [Clostridia bacterium]